MVTESRSLSAALASTLPRSEATALGGNNQCHFFDDVRVAGPEACLVLSHRTYSCYSDSATHHHALLLSAIYLAQSAETVDMDVDRAAGVGRRMSLTRTRT